MKKMTFVVLGPGGVGGFIAACLSKSGNPVTCVASEKTANAIEADGIRIESALLGDFVAHPRAVAKLDIRPDVLFVTTKATGLADALQRVDPALTRKTVIVPFLNGIEHMEVLRAHFGGMVAAGNISIETLRKGPANIVHRSPFAHAEIASEDIPPAKMREIAGALSNAGIETMVFGSEKEVLWRKLVRLNALACTTSASGMPIGFVRSNPEWRERMLGCIREAASVATAEGVPTKAEDVIAQIDALPEGLGSSMQRDIEAGKTPEIEAIPKSIVRAGKRHGIECATIKSLVVIIEKRMAGGKYND